MRIGDIITFRKDLYFEGAVQADWFYSPEKAAKVSENFVFHGKDYYGVEVKSKAKTVDTISLVHTLSKKLVDETANPLSLAIADYGTGKSHLAVTLGQLFSGSKYMPETFETIISNIKKIDEEAAESIRALCSDRNFVLVINGMKDFNLHYEILRATEKSLRLYGLNEDKLKTLNRTVETATLFFERNKETQIELFEKSAALFNWHETGDALITKIKDTLLTDDTAFDIINNVYRQVTGKEISWDEGISARSILEMLLSEYCGLNGQFDHIILLFDEFGRYLEYASGSDAGKSGDSALQQIFEVTQDAGGALQVINFIQSDIKSYLVRVDQTRNISRYIGRYDQSDKYHISSNLETVFANLIYRLDKNSFYEHIVKWQTEHESKWKEIYSQMSQWLSLSGVWADYLLFRKVVVEGIYPMHPLSTFMLTQLSDYLQNRSSMTLVSQYVSLVSDDPVDSDMPLVIPEELMRGDLYQEMLSSEINGKQFSQHCIRYDNILRKMGDKLSDRSLTVLRSNLIARILRFKTRNYEDAKQALLMCSGLQLLELNDELELLENEYAILGFDEHAGCFDFMEDSRGAHEYKIKKKRIAANWKSDFRSMFKTAKVLELGEFSELQDTAFGINHKILTNEWKFTQELLMAEDITVSLAKKYMQIWKDSRSSALPKGRLIWVYVNKDTDYAYVERLKKIAMMLQNTPVMMMLLNDSEARLSNALVNYDLLDNMDESIRQTFARAYSDDFSQAEDILRHEFEVLRKQRLCVFFDEVRPLKKRLKVSLTEVFETIYPKAISFNFDGLLTASNNFTGKGSQYFCQIVKMLLSNNVNYDTIHDFTSDVRSKITAVLMETSATSWKCISRNYVIMPPAETRAKSVYEDAVAQLNADGQYDCGKFFKKYCYPPYGLSEEAAIMMLSVILANHNYCVRVLCNDSQNSIIRWKDQVVIKDKKINIDLIKLSTLILIDTNAVESRFQQYFNRLDATTEIEEIVQLQHEIKQFADNNGVPEAIEVKYKLANSKFESAFISQKTWTEHIDKVVDELESAQNYIDIYHALTALELIDEIPLYSIFEEKHFTMSDEYREQLNSLNARAHSLINENFETWLEGTIHCKSIEAMTQFEKHVRRCKEKLLKFGFTMYARQLAAKGEFELSKKDEIRSRQELLADGKKYLSAYTSISLKNYTEVTDMLSKANELLKRLAKFENSLGNDAKKLHLQLDQCVRKLLEVKQRILTDMNNIWEDLGNAQNLEDIENVLSCIVLIMNYHIPARDLQDFEDLKETLDSFMADVSELKSAVNDRLKLEKAITTLREKYSDSDMDFDVNSVLEDVIKSVKEAIDTKERIWCKKYLTLGDRTRATVHTWKENTRTLPTYLSEKTIKSIEVMRMEADQLISEAMIEDVIFYFKKLNTEERKQCLELLMHQ